LFLDKKKKKGKSYSLFLTYLIKIQKRRAHMIEHDNHIPICELLYSKTPRSWAIIGLKHGTLLQVRQIPFWNTFTVIICQKGDEETSHVIGSRHHLFTKNNHKCSVQEGKRRLRSDFQQWQPFFSGANLYQIHVFKFSVPVTIPSLCFFD